MLFRGKLFAGALFAGALFHNAHTEQPAIVEQPSGGVVRERVVKYESRKFYAHTRQQLSQESGARLYAIDNSRSLFSNSEQRLHSAELGFCETGWVTKPVPLAKTGVTPAAEIRIVSTHYQLKQANTAFAEAANPIIVDEVAYKLHSESVIRLQQRSVSRAFVAESIVAKCRQYRKFGQLTAGTCEVLFDDDEMLMVLMLLNDMEASNHAA